MDLKTFIRDVPDFPKPGIIFKDITPLLKDAKALSYCLDQMTEPFKGKKIDCVAGAESRGFIFGPGIAERLGVGFVLVRKPGKLPYKKISYSYELEYGTDTLEIHEDSFAKGDQILLVDDLLATGGTMDACTKLVAEGGGQVVGMSFLIELSFLDGRRRFSDLDIQSLIQYEGD